jgi:hypothetical protein
LTCAKPQAAINACVPQDIPAIPGTVQQARGFTRNGSVQRAWHSNSGPGCVTNCSGNPEIGLTSVAEKA